MQCSFFLVSFKLLLPFKNWNSTEAREENIVLCSSFFLLQKMLPVTHIHTLTLEMLIINHFRAKLVNTNDTKNSAASTTWQEGEALSQVDHFTPFSRITNQDMDCQCWGWDQCARPLRIPSISQLPDITVTLHQQKHFVLPK